MTVLEFLVEFPDDPLAVFIKAAIERAREDYLLERQFAQLEGMTNLDTEAPNG